MSVEVGTVIVVQPGERVPIDGIIVEGTSALNTAALTGEGRPRDVNVRRRGHQRLCQPVRPAEGKDHQGIRRIDRFQDPRPGGKFQHEEGPRPRTSSPVLPASTPPLSATAHWRWPSSRQWSCC